MGRPRNLTALSARKGKGSPAIVSGSYTLPVWQQIGDRLGKLQSEYEMGSLSIGVWILPHKDWSKDCSQCGWNEQGDGNGVKPVQ